MINRDGHEINLGDQVSAVQTTAAQTLVHEGKIVAFRYEGLQLQIQLADGTKHWCNTLSAELVS